MRSLFPAILCSTLIVLVPSHVASEELVEAAGEGHISIEQIGPEEEPDILGTWTLIQPGNERFEADDETFSLNATETGNYTFAADSPSGASGTIEIYRNGTLEESVPRPQVSFALNAGDTIRIVITYAFTRTGTVTVTSSPSKLGFVLKGPNKSEYEGETPLSFTDVPEGQYTAYFNDIEGCITPRPISGRLIKDGRVNLTIEVACEALEEVEQHEVEQKNLEYVSVNTGDRTIVFYDVPISTWYATFVHTAAKTGTMSGYTDGSGNPVGQFGPGNNVTIAELSKIAHELAAVDEEKIRVPVENVRAKGSWFERYFASAEQRWWEVFRDRRIDPARPATRAEVIVTLLRALDVQRVWPLGKTFTDVLPTREHAAAIETAARDGLIDSGGSFRPNDPINRAELAKVLAKAMEIYVERTDEIQAWD